MFIYQKINSLIESAQSKNKGLTIQDIADSVEMSIKMLFEYRNGRSIPSVERLEKLAIFFHTDMNYFFDSFESVQPDASGQSVDVKIYNKLIHTQETLIKRIERENEELRDRLSRILYEQGPSYGVAAEGDTKLKK